MTPFSCIIVDDEPLAVNLLETYVERTPGLQLMASFTDAIAAINAIKELRPDLLFLDIQMPNIDGLELAHSVPEGVGIIFTTAFKEYAFDSYEVSALDYLLKPIRYNKFLAAVEKAKQRLTTKETTERQQPATSTTENTPPPATLFLRVDGELCNVPLTDITYVSGMKDYVMFYLDGKNKPLITHLTMKAVEEMLPKDKFLRVHRSYIVAVDKIRKIDRNDCIYIGEEIIHVPDGYQQAFHAFVDSRTFNK